MVLKTMNLSLKTRLNISFLVVIILCGLVSIGVAVHLIGNGIIDQAQEKVRTDLNTARHLFQDEIHTTKTLLHLTAQRFFIKNALVEQDLETLVRELDPIRKRESLDILSLTDHKGRVLVRARNPSVYGDSQAHDALVSRVLSDKHVMGGTVIMTQEELIREGPDLAKQAYITCIPTPKEKATRKHEETSAMCIKAAAPVFGYDGTLLGVLYGGNLLNRNHKIVDKVKDIVYQGMQYRGKDIGTATIFQHDLRIATNVVQNDGKRAIGTRLSKEVYERVLEQGLPWIDRAFVVHDWYISAYEPIISIDGKIIGVLYVGILEEKFIDMRNRAIALFLGITLTGMLMAVLVSGVLARGILLPIKQLVGASGRWAQGDLDYRVHTARQDELGKLTETFNHMASSLQERDDKLRASAQQQIMKSERLATLGQLAAGVAHEINNPLGGIMMNAYLALEDLDEKDTVRHNLETTIQEATRCRDIVKDLLDFSRQTEPKIEPANINDTLERTLALLDYQPAFYNIKITKHLCDTLPPVWMDAGQMQQVFTNMVLNAAEAMDNRGILTIVTRLSTDKRYVEIEFQDTGRGIPPKDRDKIFEPFFTTKDVGQGTGLGLSISHGIIARHGGIIDLMSETGKGTTFIIKLPLEQKEN
jgi:two-component system NtrC family sensor kinase